MNHVIEFNIDTSGLTADEEALIRALVEFLTVGHTDILVRYLKVVHLWEQAPVQRRALALKLLDDRLPSKLVAQICGLSDRQLRRYAEYRRFAQLLGQRQREAPRGETFGDGSIESWGD